MQLHYKEIFIKRQKKREIRTRYLSHTPGLRTCPSVKISNFEAHADMNIIHLNIIVPSQM